MSYFSEKYHSSLSEIQQFDFLILNTFEYRKGFFFLEKNSICEIEIIFCIGTEFFFFCEEFESMGLNKCRNSKKIKPKQPVQSSLINFDLLETKIVYEKIISNSNYYIIADTLDLKNFF